MSATAGLLRGQVSVGGQISGEMANVLLSQARITACPPLRPTDVIKRDRIGSRFKCSAGNYNGVIATPDPQIDSLTD